MKWLCIISSILLLLAIPSGWPYDFYILLRWVIFISSILVTWGFYRSKLTGWAFVFGSVAFIFNPIIPIHLTKSIWVFIDFVTTILFFLAAFANKRNEKNIQ